MAARRLFCSSSKRGHDSIISPFSRLRAVTQPGLFNGAPNDVHGARTLAYNRQNLPTLRFRGESFEYCIRRLATDGRRGLRAQLIIASKQCTHRYDKTRLSAAVRARPGKRPMACIGDMVRHRLKNID